MAKGRKRNGSSYEGRYKRYKACGSMVASDAAKALAGVRYIKSLMNVEYKSLATTITSPVDTTGTIQNVTAIAQGDDFNNRDGRKIKMFSVRIKGSGFIHASATHSRIRVMMVRDNNGSTTIPVFGDIFANVTNFRDNFPRSDDPQTNSRFTTLMDRFFLLDDNGRQSFMLDRYIKLHHHAYFTGTAATDEGKGHIYLLTASNEATNTIVFNGEVVTKWIDN